MNFEFDPNKDEANREKHGLMFASGIIVFADKDKADYEDDRKYYGEERRICIGFSEDRILSVCYTIRNKNTIRLISVRPASRKERRLYYADN